MRPLLKAAFGLNLLVLFAGCQTETSTTTHDFEGGTIVHESERREQERAARGTGGSWSSTVDRDMTRDESRRDPLMPGVPDTSGRGMN